VWLAVSNPGRDFLAGNTTSEGTAFFASVRMPQELLQITFFRKMDWPGVGEVGLMRWLGAGLVRYDIEHCDELLPPARWIPSVTGHLGEWNSDTTRVFDLQTAILPWPTASSRFYRVKISDP
jgi:hypothetical protein